LESCIQASCQQQRRRDVDFVLDGVDSGNATAIACVVLPAAVASYLA